MSQPKFDTTINRLERLKYEIEVIIEVDPHFFLCFSLISKVNININKFYKWIILHNEY